MQLTELTTVPDTALPLAQLKDHLRLGSGFAEDTLQDDLLRAFLRSALATIENRTGKTLFQRTFEWSVSAWRGADKQPLPLAPVSAVTQLALEAVTGEVTIISDGWVLKPDLERPVLEALGASLPVIPGAGRARVQMLAGFGAEWASLPADLQQAVILLAAHFNEHRHDQVGSGLPQGVRALIEPYRTVRVFMGYGE